jgi:hypothetical protein
MTLTLTRVPFFQNLIEAFFSQMILCSKLTLSRNKMGREGGPGGGCWFRMLTKLTKQTAHDREVGGSNPETIYWMDGSDYVII